MSGDDAEDSWALALAAQRDPQGLLRQDGDRILRWAFSGSRQRLRGRWLQICSGTTLSPGCGEHQGQWTAKEQGLHAVWSLPCLFENVCRDLEFLIHLLLEGIDGPVMFLIFFRFMFGHDAVLKHRHSLQCS